MLEEIQNNWQREVKREEGSTLPLSHKMFSVSSPGLRDRWTSPPTTHCHTPCRHQGTLTPPKSEYNSWTMAALDFYSESIQVAALPRGCATGGLRGSHRLYFHFPLFSQSACARLWTFPALSFLCGSCALNVNGLPYSENNDVEQRKTLTRAAPHLLKGKG